MSSWFLFESGISYYNHGYIKQGRKTVATYFELCKPLTDQQQDLVLKRFPQAQIRILSKQYAPEIKRTTIIFPKQPSASKPKPVQA